MLHVLLERHRAPTLATRLASHGIDRHVHRQLDRPVSQERNGWVARDQAERRSEDEQMAAK
jgi:hypothetical protein